MKELDLKEIRNRIDKIDKKMVELIEERLHIVKEVALYKKQNNMKIFDGEREKEVIKKNLENVKDKELGKYIEIILRDIMDSSKEYQKFKIGREEKYVNNLNFYEKRIGYTGVPGSYAYEVLSNLLKNNVRNEKNLNADKILGESISVDSIVEKSGIGAKILNFNSHKELVEAVHKGKVDMAILPIENSIVGEVRDSIDLINKKNIYIIGEVRHKIEHNLLGIKGSSIGKVETVYSHEQALIQCSEFLNSHPQWKREKMGNTALSGKYIFDMKDKKKACIANMKTKEMYNLEVLAENINNEKENYTRFFVISNEEMVVSGSEKVSIITSTKNEAGALTELLKILSKYGLNMVNLKSRPRVNKPWEYYFYIDFEGNMKEEGVRKALEEIREESTYLQILGNYRIYNLEI